MYFAGWGFRLITSYRCERTLPHNRASSSWLFTTRSVNFALNMAVKLHRCLAQQVSNFFRLISKVFVEQQRPMGVLFGAKIGKTSPPARYGVFLIFPIVIPFQPIKLFLGRVRGEVLAFRIFFSLAREGEGP